MPRGPFAARRSIVHARVGAFAILAMVSASSSVGQAQCAEGWQEGFGRPGVSSSYTTCVYSQQAWDPEGPGPEP